MSTPPPPVPPSSIPASSSSSRRKGSSGSSRRRRHHSTSSKSKSVAEVPPKPPNPEPTLSLWLAMNGFSSPVSISTTHSVCALSVAALEDTTTQLEALLRIKTVVETRLNPLLKEDSATFSPLALAAKSGKHNAVKLLLEAGAITSLRSSPTRAPALWLAVKHSQVECARLLVDAGASPMAMDKKGATAMWLAASLPEPAMVEALLKSKTEGTHQALNHMCGRQEDEATTPLYIAAHRGLTENVKLLIQDGRIKQGVWKKKTGSPTLAACVALHLDVVEVLLDAKWDDIHSLNNVEEVPALWVAGKKKSLPLAKLLVEKGHVDVNQARLSDGLTALYIAAAENAPDVVDFLLSHGAFVDVSDSNYGVTPLCVACRDNSLAVIDLLLKGGADPNKTRKREQASNIAVAAERGHLDVVKRLVAAGADVNISRNDVGGSPLNLAVHHGHNDLAKYLLSQGAKTSPTNEKDGAPLAGAVARNNLLLFDALLEAGADPNETGFTSQSALQKAAQDGQFEMLKTLVKKGGDLKKVCRRLGNTPLLYAATAANEPMVRWICEHSGGIHVDAANHMGVTALMTAINRNNLAIVKDIVEKGGADVNCCGRSSRSPLEIATQSGLREIVALLLNHGATLESPVTGQNLTRPSFGPRRVEVHDILSEADMACPFVW